MSGAKSQEEAIIIVLDFATIGANLPIVIALFFFGLENRNSRLSRDLEGVTRLFDMFANDNAGRVSM